MDTKFEYYLIIGLVWVSASVYTGLLVYKAYLNRQGDQTEVSTKTSTVRTPSSLYNPITTEKEWNAKADQIRKDHRNLVESYRQRQRDHKRITRNLMRRNKF